MISDQSRKVFNNPNAKITIKQCMQILQELRKQNEEESEVCGLYNLSDLASYYDGLSKAYGAAIVLLDRVDVEGSVCKDADDEAEDTFSLDDDLDDDLDDLIDDFEEEEQ